MIRGYDEMYLDDAMRIMGEMTDYVANYCNMDLDDYFNMFINTGYARMFEQGHPRYITGCSGVELAWMVLEKMNIKVDYSVEIVDYQCSKQYWCGYILAYYQWYTTRSFNNIMEYVSFSEIEGLYNTLHEASEDKCVEVLNIRIKSKCSERNLQTLRRLCGYSQRILAEKSGVNIRTLQQYEIGAKSINNASFKTVRSLAKALGCDMEDLYEHE